MSAVSLPLVSSDRLLWLCGGHVSVDNDRGEGVEELGVLLLDQVRLHVDDVRAR